MNDLELINAFRKVCGDEYEDGFFLTIDDVEVPNYIIGNNKAQYPEIIITPFISDGKTVATETVYCNKGLGNKIEIKYRKTKFQVDVYSKNMIELIKVKTKLSERFDDFDSPEILYYKNPSLDNWEGTTSILVNPNYNLTFKIQIFK